MTQPPAKRVLIDDDNTDSDSDSDAAAVQALQLADARMNVTAAARQLGAVPESPATEALRATLETIGARIGRLCTAAAAAAAGTDMHTNSAAHLDVLARQALLRAIALQLPPTERKVLRDAVRDVYADAVTHDDVPLCTPEPEPAAAAEEAPATLPLD